MKERVTIIGGGNGAFASAGDLSLRGHEVVLFEFPEFEANISDVKKLGGINFTTLPSSGLQEGFGSLYKITTDIEDALEGSEIIFVIIPAYGHENVAKSLAPYLRDGHIIVLAPSNFGGSVLFSKWLNQYGCEKDVHIVEFECMMYACRKKDSTSVWARGYKHGLGCAFFPSCDSDEVFNRLKEVYPILVKRNNVIETWLSNINTIVHTSLMMLNANSIDNKRDMLFYRECLTDSVENLMEKLEKERLGINGIEGITLLPLAQIMKNYYSHQGAEGNTMRELANSNPIFNWSKMPTTLEHRYITEDVPYGLIPMWELLGEYGLPNNTTKSLIDIICAMCNKDFYKDAITLDTVGIKGLTKEELIQYVTFGNKSLQV